MKEAVEKKANVKRFAKRSLACCAKALNTTLLFVHARSGKNIWGWFSQQPFKTPPWEKPGKFSSTLSRTLIPPNSWSSWFRLRISGELSSRCQRSVARYRNFSQVAAMKLPKKHKPWKAGPTRRHALLEHKKTIAFFGRIPLRKVKSCKSSQLYVRSQLGSLARDTVKGCTTRLALCLLNNLYAQISWEEGSIPRGPLPESSPDKSKLMSSLL